MTESTTKGEYARTSRDALDLANEYAAPQNEVEQRLAGIWCDALNFDRLGVDDEFFDLGGDSLGAVTIAAAVSDAFDIELKPSQIMEYYTIRLMAEGITLPSDPDLPPNLVLARAPGSQSRPPLFLIHGQYGITFLPPQFMNGFNDDQPVYIFQVPGFDGREEPFDTVKEIATSYLNTMIEIQGDGPFFIVAFCAGSWIGFEIAHQMKQLGLSPDRLILIDPHLHAAMDDEFLVARGLISGSQIPFASAIARFLKLTASDAYRRTKFFLRTGHWINGQDHESFALPKVKNFWIERQRQRQQLVAGELRQVAKITIDTGQTSGSFKAAAEADLSGSGNSIFETVAYASAKLQLAFRTYRPEPYEGAVDLLVSRKTAEKMKNPAYPVSRVMPNRNVVICGDTHQDAVASDNSRNARLIQEMIDEVCFDSGSDPSKNPTEKSGDELAN